MHYQISWLLTFKKVRWLFLFFYMFNDLLIVYILQVSWWHEVTYFWLTLVEINMIFAFEREWRFCQDFVWKKEEEEGEEFRSLKVRRKLIAHKNFEIADGLGVWFYPIVRWMSNEFFDYESMCWVKKQQCCTTTHSSFAACLASDFLLSFVWCRCFFARKQDWNSSIKFLCAFQKLQII